MEVIALGVAGVMLASLGVAAATVASRDIPAPRASASRLADDVAERRAAGG